VFIAGGAKQQFEAGGYRKARNRVGNDPNFVL